MLIDSACQVVRTQLGGGGVRAVAVAYGKIFYGAWADCQQQTNNAAAAAEEDDNEAETEVVVKKRRGKGATADAPTAEPAVTDALAAGEGDLAAVAGLLEDAVQGFLRDCVHAAEDRYFRGLRSLLQAFHDVQQRGRLDGALLRIFDPILWRSLRCANARVRAQAAVAFLDVFPLQHGEGSGRNAEDSDRILQKQFDLLTSLLRDSDHQVRAHAVQGVCHILKEYWEALPLSATHNILQYLVDTLAADASSADVRLAVFVGLGELFQQPLTHAVLKQLLPLLRNSIHDKAEKVRVAFIKILCQVGCSVKRVASWMDRLPIISGGPVCLCVI